MRVTSRKHAWHFLILLALWFGPATSEDISANICDRGRSRAARAVLRQVRREKRVVSLLMHYDRSRKHPHTVCSMSYL